MKIAIERHKSRCRRLDFRHDMVSVSTCQLSLERRARWRDTLTLGLSKKPLRRC